VGILISQWANGRIGEWPKAAHDQRFVDYAGKASVVYVGTGRDGAVSGSRSLREGQERISFLLPATLTAARFTVAGREPSKKIAADGPARRRQKMPDEIRKQHKQKGQASLRPSLRRDTP
jgi:hypothetical protein